MEPINFLSQAKLEKQQSKQIDNSYIAQPKVDIGEAKLEQLDKDAISVTHTKKLKGILEILTGAYLGYKGLISGIRRMLGIRIEEHTTSFENAKKIIKDGCMLKPEFGGTGASASNSSFAGNSAGFVHLTGVHKDWKKAYTMSGFVGDSPDNMFLRGITRKEQKITYKLASIPKTATSTFSKIKEFLKTKTFYKAGTDEYFNKNFIPDNQELAIKTKDAVKVHATKIGATVEALKREGLSGIKQNKSRVIAGVIIFAVLTGLAYKLIKNGIKNIKNKNNE